MLRDHLLVEIARHNLSSPEEIGTLRGVNLSRRDIRSLCDVMQQAAAIPSEHWPTRKDRQPEAPRETALIALATAVIRSYCLDQSLAYSLCATKKSITDLVRYRLRGAPPELEVPDLLQGWRGETVGALLDEVIAGRSAVGVVCDNGRATLSVNPSQAGILIRGHALQPACRYWRRIMRSPVARSWPTLLPGLARRFLGPCGGFGAPRAWRDAQVRTIPLTP